MSAATWSLVREYFTYDDLGTHVLKGVATPVQVYRVLQESGVQSRLDAAVPRGLTPLVGREHEVGLLRERWQRVQEGMGQVVILSGEAGIGKSCLVQELKDYVAPIPHMRLECRGRLIIKILPCILSPISSSAPCAGSQMLHRTRSSASWKPSCPSIAWRWQKRCRSLRPSSRYHYLMIAILPSRSHRNGSAKRPWKRSSLSCSQRQRGSPSCLLWKTCTGSIPRLWNF
jgi:hypothetical protein